MGVRRPVDSGRTDRAGRRIRITGTGTGSRADAPPPPSRAGTKTMCLTADSIDPAEIDRFFSDVSSDPTVQEYVAGYDQFWGDEFDTLYATGSDGTVIAAIHTTPGDTPDGLAADLPPDTSIRHLTIVAAPQGRGNGTAQQLLERYCQRIDPPAMLIAEIDPGNTASIRLFTNNRFEPEPGLHHGMHLYTRHLTAD